MKKNKLNEVLDNMFKASVFVAMETMYIIDRKGQNYI